MKSRRVAAAVSLAWLVSLAGSGHAQTAAPAKEKLADGAPAAQGPAAAPPGAPTGTPTPADPSQGDKMRDYHAALRGRRLGSQEAMGLDYVRARVSEAESLRHAGRNDEAAARLVELVEHPQFEPFQENEEGKAAIYLLGDTLAASSAYEPARAYLQRLLTQKTASLAGGSYAARAVRRLVDIALETRRYDVVLADLKAVPASAPEEIRGEVSYLTGRAREGGDADGAIAAYSVVTPRSRFWAQATYRAGLLHTARGRLKEGENLFCRVADPKRQGAGGVSPVFGDARFFAVRDLARLGLGRIAHEQGRFDDARYYYYLVPRDSNRLAEALYESATGRYEKKDYEGARELLNELRGLGAHHVYEDEAQILDAYVDLAQCKFPDADKKLVLFLSRYEPVRDAARRVAADERAMAGLLSVTRGAAPSAAEAGAATPDTLATIASLVRVDAAYGAAVKQRAVLEREASGLKLAARQLGELARTMQTAGGVAPALADGHVDEGPKDVQAAIDGVRREIDALEAAKVPEARTTMLRTELAELEARLATSRGTAAAGAGTLSSSKGADLPDLLLQDGARAQALAPNVERARRELERTESAYAKDALRRLDLRLSRLLRRARLGRIESVLGKKRALEVEIEAIANGYLPNDAVDSLDAARYLKDNEEYWPFEGDDWPDEYVGSEGLK